MLTAVVTRGAQQQVEVQFVAADEEGEEHFDPADCEFVPEEANATECDAGPNPIMPEFKELLWGGIPFVVLAVLMRFFLYPRLKRGMDARYALIRGGHEQADAARADAKAEVADYEAALATVRAEANERIESARRTLEGERQARLAEVNAGIAARREQAAAEAHATRESIRGEIATAAVDVASRTLELSLGHAPDAGAVRAAVDASTNAGVGS